MQASQSSCSPGSQSAPGAWPAAFDVIGNAPAQTSVVIESAKMVKGMEVGSVTATVDLAFAMAYHIKQGC